MSGPPRILAFLVSASVVLAGCAGSTPGSRDRASSRPTATSPVPEPSATPTRRAPAQPLVVVGRFSDPPLELTAAEASRLTSGRVRRWHGLRVLTRLPPRRAIAAVGRGRGAVAVVPLRAVAPTVRVARVDGKDPLDRLDAVDLVVVGDVMLARGVRDPAAALAPMSELLRRADVTVGNLESTLSTQGQPTQGMDSFGGSPTLLGPLRRAGFDAVSLANNHAGDYGVGALLESVRLLRRSPVTPFGAGADVAEASRPVVLERGGVRFGFVGFNAIGETPRATSDGPGALSVRMPPRTGPLVRSDLDRVLRAVRRTAALADVVVVLPHWGTQYTHRPEPVQRRVGRALVRAGADLVVGGHPHWVQGIDAVRGVPVLHSLGNFVFDMDFMEQTMRGVVLHARFVDTELKAVRLVPYRMDPQTFAPRVVGGEPGSDILSDVWSSSTGPFRDR
jgi:poly-gamma-glutamate capsule biosynthesis protein CapA/YwtB (metallophosphatase superfamily)